MATRREANVVYAAGLVQGMVLVTFPAASTIFTDPGEYDLSSTQYGTSGQSPARNHYPPGPNLVAAQGQRLRGRRR
jgi:hypothetical protein